MKALKFIIFFLSMTVFFTACKEKKNLTVPKTNAQIELDKTKKDLEEIGETEIRDTALFRKFVYFSNSGFGKSNIYCVKDLRDDSLSVVTIGIIRAGALYYNTTEVDECGIKKRYYFNSKLRKATLQQSRKKSTVIFNFFDSLVIAKKLLPIGEAVKIDRTGDIVDGGSWLLYYNGKMFYKFNSYYNNIPVGDNEIYDLFEKNIDFKPLVEELNSLY